jgi:hypothetical protein
MINWIGGNWSNAFKCLVNHDGVFDTFGMGYSTEELWFTEWEYGGTPWDKPEGYQKFNPANHVENWKHADAGGPGRPRLPHPDRPGPVDLSRPCNGGGSTAGLIVFPNENHWVLKPANSLQWHNEVFGWLNKYLAPAAVGGIRSQRERRRGAVRKAAPLSSCAFDRQRRGARAWVSWVRRTY